MEQKYLHGLRKLLVEEVQRYEVCTTGTYSRMFTSEVIATVIRNYHRHLDWSLFGVQAVVYPLHRILGLLPKAL